MSILNKVMTAREIEIEFNLPHRSVIRDIHRNKFKKNEIRKSASTWLITRKEAERVYKMKEEFTMKEEFYNLLEEMGKEVDYELVEVEFNEHSIFMRDGFGIDEDTDDLVFGQEGMTFYGVHEAVEFLERNNILVDTPK